MRPNISLVGKGLPTVSLLLPLEEDWGEDLTMMYPQIHFMRLRLAP